MSATDQTADQEVEQIEQPFEELEPEPMLALELCLSEAEALRAWLLKPAGDGSTSLDDPLVSRTLASLGRAVDSARATVNVRHELKHAGLAVDHLSDEELHDLGRRLTAALSGFRD
ncbi:MAG: hypothetical protein ACLQBB_06435 [Solirubrobacteraceae bacterium]